MGAQFTSWRQHGNWALKFECDVPQAWNADFYHSSPNTAILHTFNHGKLVQLLQHRLLLMDGQLLLFRSRILNSHAPPPGDPAVQFLL